MFLAVYAKFFLSFSIILLNKKFLHEPHLFLRKGCSKDVELVFRDIFALKEEEEEKNKYSKKTEKILHKQPKTIQLIKNE